MTGPFNFRASILNSTVSLNDCECGEGSLNDRDRDVWQ